jgi:riboflavin biosynthesis pyrimidine reductase
VVSQQSLSFPFANIQGCSSPQEALQIVENLGYHKALLAGGATLNTAFAKQHLIDELLLNVNPVMIGKGKSLFSEDVELPLVLQGTKEVLDITQFHYVVKKR